MKFSEFGAETWDEMKIFYDTCLLPVTGLTGREAPYEAADRLELLRDVMDCIEVPFQGRIVTYPVIQYGGVEIVGQINSIIRGIRQGGFTHVIVASILEELNEELLPEADLIVTPERCSDHAGSGQVQYLEVREQILKLWKKGK